MLLKYLPYKKSTSISLICTSLPTYQSTARHMRTTEPTSLKVQVLSEIVILSQMVMSVDDILIKNVERATCSAFFIMLMI